MKILLASLGTAGDVHPFAAIGRYLRQRGYRVELMSNPVFAPLAEQAGLDFHGVGSEQDYRECFTHHYVWDPVKGLGVMWRYLARRAMQASYDRIGEVHRSEGCIVVYGPFFMPAARVAAEKPGLRAVSVYTAPAMIRSCRAPLSIAHWRLPRGTPSFVARGGWALLDHLKMQPLAMPDLARLRDPLGLPPIRESIFGSWLHSPQRGIALFPDWFAQAADDWPKSIVQTGFPVYDADNQTGLGKATQAFLDAGEAPLVFTSGSAMHGAQAFFETAVAAAQVLGRRALLLAPSRDSIPDELPPSIMHSRYEAFGLLLPRAAALVHHGGIGTIAQALRTGLPQMVLPMAYDQFDNARRLRELGVARELAHAALGVDTLARTLEDLLGDDSVRSACATARSQIAADDPMPLIERLIVGPP